MLGELSADEIEQLLLRETVGRIGCQAEGRVYIVPITYAYDGDCVYAHSADGLKLRTMRANPNVCFQIEAVADPAHWQSVVAWGTYQELSGADEERAAGFLRARFQHTPVSETALRTLRFHGVAQEAARTILYRIRLDEKTGRFER